MGNAAGNNVSHHQSPKFLMNIPNPPNFLETKVKTTDLYLSFLESMATQGMRTSPKLGGLMM
jgi:hypothetical protein